MGNFIFSNKSITFCTAALERAQVSVNDVDEVIFGNVLSANLGQVNYLSDEKNICLL